MTLDHSHIVISVWFALTGRLPDSRAVGQVMDAVPPAPEFTQWMPAAVKAVQAAVAKRGSSEARPPRPRPSDFELGGDFGPESGFGEEDLRVDDLAAAEAFPGPLPLPRRHAGVLGRRGPREEVPSTTGQSPRALAASAPSSAAYLSPAAEQARDLLQQQEDQRALQRGSKPRDVNKAIAFDLKARDLSARILRGWAGGMDLGVEELPEAGPGAVMCRVKTLEEVGAAMKFFDRALSDEEGQLAVLPMFASISG